MSVVDAKDIDKLDKMSKIDLKTMYAKKSEVCSNFIVKYFFGKLLPFILTPIFLVKGFLLLF